jgi:leucyl aminopeptidase
LIGVRFELSKDLPPSVEAVIVPACADRLGGGDTDWDYLRARGFEGKPDQVFTLPSARTGSAIIMVGLGPAGSVDSAVIRRASAVSARAAARHAVVATHLLAALPEGIDLAGRVAATQALAEGAVLGAYQFIKYKSQGEPPKLAQVFVIGTGGKRAQRALDLGSQVSDAVALARDLVNEPGGSLTPSALAEIAVEIAEREGLQITVLDEEGIREAGLGGVLGVNRGSSQPPRFIELSYAPANPRGHLALVGKGITFDSGGLSLKTGAGMMTMKDDMGGAAAILGAFSAINAVTPRCRVTGYIPATDNMTGPDATRPGDVLKIRNGKTVEVLNTDAEGRLILADALSLASEAKPDAIVDLATLSGAVEVALGNRIAGLMGNHDGWIDQVRDAATRVGERVWPLPLPDDYRKRIDSDVADLRNISRTTDGGTITAGLFLREFVGDGIPWAHLDIAGAAWSGDVEGEVGKGGTGFGVRTLLELARKFQKPK